MDRRRDLLQGIAILSGVFALLHVVYAASGGIADPLGLAWILALGTLLAAALASWAAWRGPWWLAWPACVLMALPVAVAWPAPLASFAGQIVVFLLAAVVVGLAVETARRPRAV